MDSFDRAQKAHDAQTPVQDEETATRDCAIEDRAIEIYREMMDSPELMAEAMQEADNDDLVKLADALGDAYRREIPSWDIQYLRKITDATGDLVMGYSKKLAEQAWEAL